MPFFFPSTNDAFDIRVRYGTNAGVEGLILVVENGGNFRIPKSIQDKAESSPGVETLSDEEQTRWLLHLMVDAAESEDNK
ncbi:hypothetical protein [Hymenobacter arizonensis]|uniref:Uncharacterized protein n=1 Tax=Hymenobacter arizonensis TaxID=1227077 RepID=A0A1I6BND3_HYMAR|nr:hypothetical protein [Hymenobacter arizonensis]SFQ82436.1 hypothetical protein SAMN04515668_4812 [Hymenobacter arizonensis]